MIKNKLIKHLLVILLMLALPLIGFFAIDLIVPLNPVVYVGAAFGSFYSICIIASLKLISSKRNVKTTGFFIFYLKCNF